MRKVWIYKRKRIKAWWVGCYESGKRKAKALPSKALAEHYRQIKYTQLNSDVFTGTVAVNWQQMVEEYRHGKQVAGYVEASLYEVALTLRHFERLVGKCNSKQITQNAIDKYILQRSWSALMALRNPIRETQLTPFRRSHCSKATFSPSSITSTGRSSFFSNPKRQLRKRTFLT